MRPIDIICLVAIIITLIGLLVAFVNRGIPTFTFKGMLGMSYLKLSQECAKLGIPFEIVEAIWEGRRNLGGIIDITQMDHRTFLVEYCIGSAQYIIGSLSDE